MNKEPMGTVRDKRLFATGVLSGADGFNPKTKAMKYPNWLRIG